MLAEEPSPPGSMFCVWAWTAARTSVPIRNSPYLSAVSWHTFLSNAKLRCRYSVRECEEGDIEHQAPSAECENLWKKETNSFGTFLFQNFVLVTSITLAKANTPLNSNHLELVRKSVHQKSHRHPLSPLNNNPVRKKKAEGTENSHFRH